MSEYEYNDAEPYPCDECGKLITEGVTLFDEFGDFCSSKCKDKFSRRRKYYHEFLANYELEVTCDGCNTAIRSSQAFLVEGISKRVFNLRWCECHMSAHFISLDDRNIKSQVLASPATLVDKDTGEVVVKRGDHLENNELRHTFTAYLQMAAKSLSLDARLD